MADLSTLKGYVPDEPIEDDTPEIRGQGDVRRADGPSSTSAAYGLPEDGFGDERFKPAFKAIIAALRPGRAFYRDSTPNGSFPDCISYDFINGIGTPGGKCAGCPFDKFGSAKDGTGPGKACSEHTEIMLVVEGDGISKDLVESHPASMFIALRVPITSVNHRPPSPGVSGLFDYSEQLKGNKDGRLPIWAVQTRLATDKTKNKAGIEYNRMAFSVVRKPKDKAEFDQWKAWHVEAQRILNERAAKSVGGQLPAPEARVQIVHDPTPKVTPVALLTSLATGSPSERAKAAFLAKLPAAEREPFGTAWEGLPDAESRRDFEVSTLKEFGLTV